MSLSMRKNTSIDGLLLGRTSCEEALLSLAEDLPLCIAAELVLKTHWPWPRADVDLRKPSAECADGVACACVSDGCEV